MSLHPREQAQLDREIARHDKYLSNMANKRLARLAKWFQAEFPKRSLEIVFGMGSETVKIDGRYLNTDRLHVDGLTRNTPSLQPISDAIQDINEITFGYMRACPDDVHIKGKDKVAA